MLVDHVEITIKAGNGGKGAVHFRRNAQTAKGGPDGGNGGNGGSVYVQGVDDILGLAQFRYKKRIQAEDGVAGGRQNMFGRNGKDTTIFIPLGTLVTDTKTHDSFEIVNLTQKILIAQGGLGGKGNTEFKSPTDQAPHYAQPGTPGEEKILTLELRLIADVGFIGLPNAGKSSLLKELTHAQPKIGNYPFTTLEPNIGMMGNITLADIPGLIEGAHKGKGLGIQFLKHIMKTKLLTHCIDSTTNDISKSYSVVHNELGEYAHEMLQKPEIIVLTKIDELPQDTAQEKIIEAKQLDKIVLTTSIHDTNSLQTLQKALEQAVKEQKQ